MKKQDFKLLFNPFERIAGWEALAWGLGGLIVSTFLSYYTHYHYHGLLHYGPAPNDALWCFAAERIVVWLVPAILFYIGGLIFSKSRIRIVDVLGTVAFALLPLILLNLYYLLPPLQRMQEIVAMDISIMQIVEQPGFMMGVILGLAGIVFLIGSLIWLFFALKVSCNLKSYSLAILFCIGVFGGDVVTRIIIGRFY